MLKLYRKIKHLAKNPFRRRIHSISREYNHEAFSFKLLLVLKIILVPIIIKDAQLNIDRFNLLKYLCYEQP